jgi:glucokinase
MKHIGVDIGGSHITAAQVDLQKGEVVASTLSRAKVHPHGSAEEILSIWANTIKGIRWLGRWSNWYRDARSI